MTLMYDYNGALKGMVSRYFLWLQRILKDRVFLKMLMLFFSIHVFILFTVKFKVLSGLSFY